MEGAYENEMMEYECEEGCKTPISDENQIRLNLKCPPPPPKKNKPINYGAKREPPKNGYYQPPDLELLFVTPPLSS
ncbi:hypothetical protein MKX01_026265 [Papaver californicum]|nr:hypothetical protein MKX01_026265 [Papaver californicum]